MIEPQARAQHESWAHSEEQQTFSKITTSGRDKLAKPPPCFRPQEDMRPTGIGSNSLDALVCLRGSCLHLPPGIGLRKIPQSFGARPDGTASEGHAKSKRRRKTFVGKLESSGSLTTPHCALASFVGRSVPGSPIFRIENIMMKAYLLPENFHLL